MHSTVVRLYEGEADSWAINVKGDQPETYRARKGFGSDFKKVWSLEVQSAEPPDVVHVDWAAVLERAVYAYDMNDPLVTEFEWPTKETARS